MRRVTVRERQFTEAAGKVKGVAEVTVAISEGRLQVDAGLEDKQVLQFSLLPLNAAFAPHGAKEISFAVQPETGAGDLRAVELVGAIAAEIAYAVWGPFLRLAGGSREHSAFVERDGDILRVDLRTVPEVRAALRQTGTAIPVEMIEIREMTAEPGALNVALGIPGLRR